MLSCNQVEPLPSGGNQEGGNDSIPDVEEVKLTDTIILSDGTVQRTYGNILSVCHKSSNYVESRIYFTFISLKPTQSDTISYKKILEMNLITPYKNDFEFLSSGSYSLEKSASNAFIRYAVTREELTTASNGLYASDPYYTPACKATIDCLNADTNDEYPMYNMSFEFTTQQNDSYFVQFLNVKNET